VDRYKAAKLREGALGPNQINKSIGLLAMILDAAAAESVARPVLAQGRYGSSLTRTMTRVSVEKPSVRLRLSQKSIGSCGRSTRAICRPIPR
jgi:hypothetical protein